MTRPMANVLRWIGLIGIMTVAVMRCMIVFAPTVVFDVDPVFDSNPLAGLGPAGSLFLDVALLLSCVSAILGEWLSRRGIDALLLLLPLIPLPVICWHGSSDSGDLWKGSTWFAAAVACVAVAHLARDRTMRLVMISLLLATVVPLLVRAGGQLTYEHAEMVEVFEEQRSEILRDRGWEPDSSAARLYERRLRQPDPIGWFATTNIFASFMAFGLILSAGLAIAAVRTKLQNGWTALMSLLALACTAGLWFSGSKGGALAALVGIVVLIALNTKIASGHSRSIGKIVIALIIVTVLAVVVRGVLLPEDFAGDRSLLFRWHYQVASARILAGSPLIGVGPDGYQAAYMRHRLPRNPEEVTSAHSMFWDWLCSFGILGIAWIMLAILLLWRSKIESQTKEPTETQSNSTIAITSICAISLLACAPSIAIESHVLDAQSLFLRILGAIGFVLVAILVFNLINRVAKSLVISGVISGVAALLVHSQIEMTFYQPGSVVFAICALGVVGQVRISSARTSHVATCLAATILTCSAGWITSAGVIPAMRQQNQMVEAAEILQPIADDKKNESLLLTTREESAEKLVHAYESWPINVFPLEAATRQMGLAADVQGDDSFLALSEGYDIINGAIEAHGKPSSISLAVGISTRLAMATGDQEYWNEAIRFARQLTELDPHGLGAWRRLGDVLWLSGNRTEAAEAYKRAIECDANFKLDSLKQLTEKERETIQLRIE